MIFGTIYNLKKIFRQFAENELWPIAGKIDKTCEYPEQQIKTMGELGKPIDYFIKIIKYRYIKWRKKKKDRGI